MTDREKLIELMNAEPCPSPVICDPECKYADLQNCYAERMADHLIANGVTVQKWIPVTERLPNDKKIIDGEEYIKNVAIRIKDNAAEKIAFYDEEEKCWFDTDFFSVAGEVTHWMPLPEPPIGD